MLFSTTMSHYLKIYLVLIQNANQCKLLVEMLSRMVVAYDLLTMILIVFICAKYRIQIQRFG